MQETSDQDAKHETTSKPLCSAAKDYTWKNHSFDKSFQQKKSHHFVVKAVFGMCLVWCKGMHHASLFWCYCVMLCKFKIEFLVCGSERIQN